MGNVQHCCVLQITFSGCFLFTSNIGWLKKYRKIARKEMKKQVGISVQSLSKLTVINKYTYIFGIQ